MVVDRRWSPGETAALIEAWRPLYNRRRGGESDVWVPASQRSRARSTRTLVPEDWRAVATAVNSFRTDINLDPIRTHKQCKMRVELLKSQFGDEQLAAPSWFGFLPNTAGLRGHSSRRVLASAVNGGDECGGRAAGGQAHGGSAVAEGGSASAEAEEMGVPEGTATDDASHGVAMEVEEGGAATKADEPLGNGATGFLERPIPKKRRTGASDAGAGEGRAHEATNARRARVDEGRAPAGGFAATVLEMAAALGEAHAAASNDAAVVSNLSDMYREVAMKRIELQGQIMAALAATTVDAAVPEPDAAHA